MDSKTQSILGYSGVFWSLAFLAGKSRRDRLSRYHLKQGLGLWVFAIILNVVVYAITVILSLPKVVIGYTGIFFLILMVFGIIHAVNEVEKPVPVIGKIFENRFGFIA